METMSADELLNKNMEQTGVIRALRANAREDAATISRLIKERDEAIADRDIARNSSMYSDRAHDRMTQELHGLYKQLDQSRNEYLRVCSERDDLLQRWEAAK